MKSTRETAFQVIYKVLEEDEHSHVVLRHALLQEKDAEKRERAFVTRLVEGTLERLITLDYILNQVSKTPVKKMKPVIRTVLRMSVYQMLFMDSVPDSAVCNEAVKLVKAKGLQGLSGFANGVLRNIARSFGVGQDDIMRLNPDLNPRRLVPGEIICIPLAPSPVEIIINIMAKRLTVYRGGSIFREYIVATGKPETPTPVGNFEIVNKEIDPGGPYGTRWLGLSAKGYGIHGTNDPSSIGTAASNGCIRMYNEDIESLFDITVVGTPVRILP